MEDKILEKLLDQESVFIWQYIFEQVSKNPLTSKLDFEEREDVAGEIMLQYCRNNRVEYWRCCNYTVAEIRFEISLGIHNWSKARIKKERTESYLVFKKLIKMFFEPRGALIGRFSVFAHHNNDEGEYESKRNACGGLPIWNKQLPHEHCLQENGNLAKSKAILADLPYLERDYQPIGCARTEKIVDSMKLADFVEQLLLAVGNPLPIQTIFYFVTRRLEVRKQYLVRIVNEVEIKGDKKDGAHNDAVAESAIVDPRTVDWNILEDTEESIVHMQEMIDLVIADFITSFCKWRKIRQQNFLLILKALNEFWGEQNQLQIADSLGLSDSLVSAVRKLVKAHYEYYQLPDRESCRQYYITTLYHRLTSELSVI